MPHQWSYIAWMSTLNFFHLNKSLPVNLIQTLKDINRLYFPNLSHFMSFSDLNIALKIFFVFRSRPGSLSFHDMTAFIMKALFSFQSWLIRTKPEIIHQSRITRIFPASVFICSQALSPYIVGMSFHFWDQKKRPADGFLPVSITHTYTDFSAANPELSRKTYVSKNQCRYGSVQWNKIKNGKCVETREIETSKALSPKYPAV